MIPKADILAAAKELGLQQTIVEKDYVLGWVLWGIGGASKMATWVLKGGTCLKKCFFDTYRFSEDLDFTVPAATDVQVDLIREALEALAAEVHQELSLIHI